MLWFARAIARWIRFVLRKLPLRVIPFPWRGYKLYRFISTAKLKSTIREATAEATSPSKLQELASHPLSSVRRAVVSNPNTPTEVLFELGEEFPQELLNNPIIDLLCLEDRKVFSKLPHRTAVAILKLSSIPEFVLEAIVNMNRQVLLWQVVSKPALPTAILKKLVMVGGEIAQAACLRVDYISEVQNKNITSVKQTELCSQKILYKRHSLAMSWLRALIPAESQPDFYAANNYYYISDRYSQWQKNWELQRIESDNRYAFQNKFNHKNWQTLLSEATSARESSTSIETLRQLAKHKNKRIRCALAKNPGLPKDVCRQLAQDKQKSVRGAIAKSLHTPPEVLKLLSKPKYGVRYAVAQNPHTPIGTLIELSRNHHPIVNKRLASNPSTPDFVLRDISTRADENVKIALAKNPALPADVASTLAQSESNEIRKAIAHNSADPQVLLSLVERGKTKEQTSINLLVAHNSHADEAVLQKLLKTEQQWDFYLAILANPYCSYEITQQIFGQLLNKNFKYFFTYQLAVLFDRNAPCEKLRTAASSDYWLERYAVAVNPNTPRETRKILSKDINLIVRKAARDYEW